MFNIRFNSILLLTGTFFSRLCMFMSVPYLAIYLSNVIHLNTTEIGLIIGINPLVSVGCSLFCGQIIDRLALKKILVFVPLLWGCIFFAFSFTSEYYVFLLLNGLNGLCYVLYEPACKKALSLTSKGDSMILFNLRYAAINIGAVLGPVLNTLLHFEKSITPYLYLGLVYIFVGLLNSRLKKEDLNIESIKATGYKQEKFPKISRFFVYFIIGISFSYFGYSQLNSTISQYLSATSVEGIRTYSSLLSFSALLIILLQFPVLRVIKGFKSNLTLMASNILFSVCIMTVILFPQRFWIIFFVFTYSLGEMLLGARFDYAIDQFSDNHNKGQYFSLSEVVKTGSTLGPIIGGYLVSVLGWGNHTIIFSALSLITLTGTLLIYWSKIK